MQQDNLLLSSLEIENYVLKQKLNTCSSETIREIYDLKELYDSRLAQLKMKIRDLAGRKEATKRLAEREEVNAKHALERLDQVNARYDSLNKRLNEVYFNKSKCQNEFDLISMRIERCELELPRLRKRVESLGKQMNTIRKQVANESAYRVRLEHNYSCLSRIEEHQFNLHQSKLNTNLNKIKQENEMHTNKLEILNDVNKREDINNNNDTNYNINFNLLEELEKVKLKTLVKIKELEPRIEFIFKNELEVLSLRNEHSDLKELKHVRAKLDELKLRLDESQLEYEYLKSRKERYEERIKRLENVLNESENYYDVNLKRKTQELNELKKELEELRTGYQDLLVIKEKGKKQIESFYDELHVKGILFQFHNLRNGKKFKFCK